MTASTRLPDRWRDGSKELGSIDLRRADQPPPLGEILSATTHDLQDLFRMELELAKVELQDTARDAAKAGSMLGAGGLMAYLALALLCVAAAMGLAVVMPTGVAFLIVGAAVALIAVMVLIIGRTRLLSIEPVPRQTVETIKEDVQWAEQLRN